MYKEETAKQQPGDNRKGTAGMKGTEKKRRGRRKRKRGEKKEWGGKEAKSRERVKQI